MQKDRKLVGRKEECAELISSKSIHAFSYFAHYIEMQFPLHLIWFMSCK